MSIEETIRNYLANRLDCPCWLKVPKGLSLPAEYVLIQKTGSSRRNLINYAVIAVQSCADDLVSAMDLNEEVKSAMDNLVEIQRISGAALNSDYDFTDTQTKKYRYQAVYDITHY